MHAHAHCLSQVCVEKVQPGKHSLPSFRKKTVKTTEDLGFLLSKLPPKTVATEERRQDASFFFGYSGLDKLKQQ